MEEGLAVLHDPAGGLCRQYHLVLKVVHTGMVQLLLLEDERLWWLPPRNLHTEISTSGKAVNRQT
jgi:hypothetical protein